MQFQPKDVKEGDSSLRGSETFIERKQEKNILRSVGAKTLFNELENVLVLERDVKLSEQS